MTGTHAGTTPRRIDVARIVWDDESDQLASIGEGDWVSYGDKRSQIGVVVSSVDPPIEWPTGDDESETIDPNDDAPVYVVARLSGGSKPFTADELDPISREEAIGDESAMPDNPVDDAADDAELSVGYTMLSRTQVAELHDRGLSELIDVPGVDDPGVGFDSWPDSWVTSETPARLIALDAWASMGGTWRGCFAEIGSRRLCSAFKDEILQTERWRNRF
jgi:hypothetical protein